jgi:hypothetical protein
VTDNDNTTTRDYWVIQSPRRDGSWRGVENCVESKFDNGPFHGPLLFESPEAAETFRTTVMNDVWENWSVVRVRLEVPAVGRPLDSVKPRAS